MSQNALELVRTDYNTIPNNQNLFEKIPSTKQIRQQISFYCDHPNVTSVWERRFGIIFTKNHWLVAKISSKEERLRLLHWKIVHKIYPTNILLHKMGIRNSHLCEDCKVLDTLDHFFFDCNKIKKVWVACKNYIFSKIGKNLHFESRDIILGYNIEQLQKNEVRFINAVILITKMVISKYRYGEGNDIICMFESDISIREKYLYCV